MDNSLCLLSEGEQRRRICQMRRYAKDNDLTNVVLVLSDNATLYWLTGRVFTGWAYIPMWEEEPLWFYRRPIGLNGKNVIEVNKPELIPSHLRKLGRDGDRILGLEYATQSYDTIERLKSAFIKHIRPDAVTDDFRFVPAAPIVSHARAIKTPAEIALMEESGRKQTMVYREIPRLYVPDQTDYQLDVDIEILSRFQGCLGNFRIAGNSMEFFMGNILTGDNADEPSPYDFALGGAGINPSLPVGASGEKIKPGCTVSVDVNGCYTGYMTDMTRVFSLGEIPQIARDAHQCSIDIHRRFREMARPGVAASDLYNMAKEMAVAAGFEKYFMGHRQHASFVGHGVGIEINELPVLAPRSRDILQAGNAIALEPKFVIPHVGAVGNENTYIIEENGVRCLTNAPEEILPFRV